MIERGIVSEYFAAAGLKNPGDGSLFPTIFSRSLGSIYPFVEKKVSFYTVRAQEDDAYVYHLALIFCEIEFMAAPQCKNEIVIFLSDFVNRSQQDDVGIEPKDLLVSNEFRAVLNAKQLLN